MTRPVLTPYRFFWVIQVPLLCVALSACGLVPQENSALTQRSSLLQTAELTQGQRRFGDATYTGELRGNQPDGEGTLVWDDGRRYQGLFSRGQMQGHGTLTLEDGRRYEGAFSGDRPFGEGTLTLADGQRLTGTFAGLDEARGSLAMANDEQLSGQFRNGAAYGLMRLTAPGQPPRQQLWLEGERLMGHLAEPADFGRNPQAVAREIIASHQWYDGKLPDPVARQTLQHSAALLQNPAMGFTAEQQVAILADWPALAATLTELPYPKRLQELAKEKDCDGVATAMSLFPDSYAGQLQQTCADIAGQQRASAADYAYLLDSELITWELVPDHLQPMLSGPMGARPVDLMAQIERGTSASQLASLVAAGSNAYPMVYGSHQQSLQKAGVPSDLINAMQSANLRYFNEQEELRRFRAEEQRISREIYEEQRRQEELQARMEREEERLRQAEFEAEYGSNASSGVNWMNVIEHVSQAATELNQLQNQINQQNRQIAMEAQRIQNQQQIDAWQRERQQAAQRQQAMDRQRQVQEQQRLEREAQLNRQREQQAVRQREMAQRMAQIQAQQQAAVTQATASRTSASTGGGSATSVATNSGPQKVYEPNMVTVTGKSTAGFSSRDMTEELALLNGINQVHQICRDRDARVDSVPNTMLRSKTAPPRWNFGAPQCRQGGWAGKEWFCDIAVSGTCYRMQSFSTL